MWTCLVCGLENEDRAGACICGYQREDQAEPSKRIGTWTCLVCGEEVPETENTCICGYSRMAKPEAPETRTLKQNHWGKGERLRDRTSGTKRPRLLSGAIKKIIVAVLGLAAICICVIMAVDYFSQGKITASPSVPATLIPVVGEPSQDLPTGPSSSTFYFNSTASSGICVIVMDGTIDKNTPGNLVNAYNSYAARNNCSTVFLNLNSNGGDVEAALKAGDFIRNNKFWTFIRQNDACASSCVFMFLGGVNRVTFGKIGLHRPFSERLSSTESTSRANYERINRLVRQYLNRMNIPERLLDEINAVPPDEIRWLYPVDDSNQLESFHITGEDPVYQDLIDSKYAGRLGISKSEFYAREQKSKVVCGALDINNHDEIEAYGQCYDDVMHGRR
jgi:hypothetical protein